MQGDLNLVPGSGRSSGEENGNPLQYTCLENPWTEMSGGLQSKGGKESDATEPRPFSENAILQVDSNNEI